jgi:hypothetical protein
LLHRQGEWDQFAGEIVMLTRGVLDNAIQPSLARALPDLPEDALR